MEPALLERVDLVRDEHVREDQLDPRTVLDEALGDLRNDAVDRGVDESHPAGVRPRRARRRGGFHGPLDFAQGGSGFLQELAPRLRQLHDPTGPKHKRNADMLFELLDLPAERRLREAQALRGAPEGRPLVPGCRPGVAQEAGAHAVLVPLALGERGRHHGHGRQDQGIDIGHLSGEGGREHRPAPERAGIVCRGDALSEENPGEETRVIVCAASGEEVLVPGESFDRLDRAHQLAVGDRLQSLGRP